MKKPPDPHYRHRFPAELISHAVWLYHVFSLSFRDVELILAERGVVVSYESIRRWCLKFGASFADKLRRRRPRPGDKWYLDEVFIRIQGELHYLWRAVDQDGIVLDILVQRRRDAGAAPRTADAALQVSTTSPALPVCTRFHLWPLSSTTPSDDRAEVSDSSFCGLQGLEPGDVRPDGSINASCSMLLPKIRLQLVKLTMPVSSVAMLIINGYSYRICRLAVSGTLPVGCRHGQSSITCQDSASPAVGCGHALHLIGGGGFLAGFVLAGSAAGGAA